MDSASGAISSSHGVTFVLTMGTPATTASLGSSWTQTEAAVCAETAFRTATPAVVTVSSALAATFTTSQLPINANAS